MLKCTTTIAGLNFDTTNRQEMCKQMEHKLQTSKNYLNTKDFMDIYYKH